LDQMLPGEDGLSILRRLRGAGDKTPILMLTAKGDDVDRIIGLEMGADDYLPKPFNPRELLARLNAILRRAPVNQPGAPSLDGQNVIVKFGNLTLDLNTRTLVKTVNETTENIALTTGEFSVLKILAQHARQPISRDKLMVLARGREYGAFDRSLDVQISRLRKLIETDAQSPRYLQTVWGVGYVLIPD
jgi:two-component system, OmpR family, phosphate regulon response regulator OmpR